MLCDKRELKHISAALERKKEATCRNLAALGISLDVEERDLKAGDYLWVARHKASKQELVLDHLVERKSYTDLWHSVTGKGKDGSTVRYYEQRRRMVYVFCSTFLLACFLPSFLPSFSCLVVVSLSLSRSTNACLHSRIPRGTSLTIISSPP